MSGVRRGAAALCILAAIAANAAAAAKAVAPSAAPPVAASAASAAPSAPIEFSGELEAGRTYGADLAYDANALHIWRPVKDVQVTKNSAWTIEWVNLAKFPALASASVRAKPQRFRFKVLKADVSSGAPDMPWTIIYRCEILAVGPVAAPAGRKR
jgi:hypothetical protein